MKRAFVILLVVFALVVTVSSGFAAQSDLSPFHGLTFDEPDASSTSDLTIQRVGDVETVSTHLVRWSSYQGELPQLTGIGGIDIIYEYSTLPSQYGYSLMDSLYDLRQVGNVGVVERGPKETLAGLPAFYAVIESKANVMGNQITARSVNWYLFGEDCYFTITNTIGEYNINGITPGDLRPYFEQHNQIFEDFLNSIGTTDALDPGDGGNDSGNDDGSDGENNSGGGGGCNAGGLFSLAALIGFCAFQKGKKA